jgi:uncharacterized protein
MLIGIISDTHDHLVGLRKAIQIFKKYKAEMIIHCGDWVSPFTLEFFDEEMKDFPVPIKSVVGNNPGDIKRTMSSNSQMKNPIEWAKRSTLDIEIGDKKAVVYHGDDHTLLQSLIDSQHYDLIFTGHTHQPRNEMIGKTLVVNPGSTAYAREGKIFNQASVAIYNSTKHQAEIIELE